MRKKERESSGQIALFLGVGAGLVQLFFWGTAIIFYEIPWLTGPLFRNITVEEVVELSRLSGAIERSELQMLWRDITVPIGTVSVLFLLVGEYLFLDKERAHGRFGRRFLVMAQAVSAIGAVLCLIAIKVIWNLSETVFSLTPAFVLSVLIFMQLAVFCVQKDGG